MKIENRFLRSELGTADRVQALSLLQKRTPSRTVAARVIGTGPGANSRVIFVDRGSLGGVKVGMAAVNADGLIGKVTAAYPTASQIMLVTDPGFAAGVISAKNRVQGTLKGDGQPLCRVDYLQNEEKVEVGEWFYTSGEDRIFPRGVPVGRVTSVGAGSPFKDVLLTPSGLARAVEEVLIVLEGVHQPIPEAPALSRRGSSVAAASGRTAGNHRARPERWTRRPGHRGRPRPGAVQEIRSDPRSRLR